MQLDSTCNVMVPVSLADYTRSALVVPELHAGDTAGVIGELSQVLQRQGCLPDVLSFYHSALNQELLADSALECGIAVPHARLSGVKQLQFALGRAPQPIPWGARGVRAVRFVFLLAVPATDAASYLHLLAGLANLGRQNGWLTELGEAASAEQMVALLEKIKLSRG